MDQSWWSQRYDAVARAIEFASVDPIRRRIDGYRPELDRIYAEFYASQIIPSERLESKRALRSTHLGSLQGSAHIAGLDVHVRATPEPELYERVTSMSASALENLYAAANKAVVELAEAFELRERVSSFSPLLWLYVSTEPYTDRFVPELKRLRAAMSHETPSPRRPN